MGQEYGSAALLQPKAAPAVLQVRLPAANMVTVEAFDKVIVEPFDFIFAEKVIAKGASVAVGVPLTLPVDESNVRPPS